MPRKANNPNAVKVPKFTIERTTGKKIACAKVVLPMGDVKRAGEILTDLIEQAVNETGAVVARGTISLYKV